MSTSRTTRPRIRMAFFGSSLVSAYWNGAATYYRGLVRELHAHGVDVTFFEPDAYDRQQHRDLPDPPWATSVVYPATEAGVQGALERAAGADFVVKTSGVGVFDGLLEHAVLGVRPERAIFWDVDAPATLARVHANPSDPFLPLIPRYAVVLTYGGGPRVVAAYRALGARDCVPIYNALDPTSHFPVAPEPRFEAHLALLANRLPDRERRIEEFFFRPVAARPAMSFLLGGNGWAGRPMPANVGCLGHVYTRDHNAFNSTPHAVLNVNRDDMAAFGFSPPTRIFEAAGAGACLITDAWEGIERFLEPGREVLVAPSGASVAEHLDRLDPPRADAIGRAARRRVLAEHTYTHRVRELLAVLDLMATPPARREHVRP